jgi:hypothetical protein
MSGDAMADEKRHPGSQDSRRRRRAPTIDLPAQEVAKKASVPAEPAGAFPESIPPVQPGPETPQVETLAPPGAEPPVMAAIPEPPEETAKPQPSDTGSAAPNRWSPNVAWALVGAAMGGASAAILLAGGLWLAGSLSVGSNEALETRLAKVEGRLQTLAAAPVGVEAKAVGEMTARLGRIESAISDNSRVTNDAVTALRERIDAVAAATRRAQERADAAANAAEAAQKAERAGGPDGWRTDLNALVDRIGAIEQSLRAMQAELVKGRAGAADDRAGRLAVAALALETAVHRGQPFAAELAAAKALAPDATALEPLDAFAGSGIGSASALAREINPLLPAMLAAAAPERTDGSFLYKLQANAEKLVRIYPVGEVAGDEPVAVIARIEAKAARSDIDGVLAEAAKLPAKVQAPMQDWIKKAQSRAAALGASHDLARAALGSLTKSPS